MNNILYIIITIVTLKLLFYFFIYAAVMVFIKIKNKNENDKNVNNTNTACEKKVKQKYYILRSSIINGLIRYSDNMTSKIPSHLIRKFIYMCIYKIKMESNVVIHYGAEIRASYKLSIGEGTIIGDKSLLDARNNIYIGKNVNISSNVSIYTEQHDYQDKYFRCTGRGVGPVKIEDYVWIGPNTIVLPNVTIRKGAVVAAGSVITKDVDEFTLVGGIPGKFITKRNIDIEYKFNGEHMWFL